jgi:hypothetical protein
MVRSADVLDYQVRQTPRGIDTDVLTAVPIDAARLADSLAEALAEAGLDNPAVAYRRCWKREGRRLQAVGLANHREEPYAMQRIAPSAALEARIADL